MQNSGMSGILGAVMLLWGAGESTANAGSPPDADEFRATLQRRYDRLQTLRLEVVLTDTTPLGASPPQSAVVWFQAPDRVRVEFASPPRTICAVGDRAQVISDGGTIPMQGALPLAEALRLFNAGDEVWASFQGQVTQREDGSEVVWTRTAAANATLPRSLSLALSREGELRALVVTSGAGARTEAKILKLEKADTREALSRCPPAS